MFTLEVAVTSVSPGAISRTRLVIRMSAPPLPFTSCPVAMISASIAAGSRRSNTTFPL